MKLLKYANRKEWRELIWQPLYESCMTPNCHTLKKMEKSKLYKGQQLSNILQQQPLFFPNIYNSHF